MVIENALANVATKVGLVLPDVQISLRVSVNLDYTIDGQLTVRNLPSHLSSKQVIAAIESCVEPVASTWISVVIQFGARTQEARDELERKYARVRGLFQVATNHQRNTHGKRPINFRKAMEIAGHIEEKGQEIIGVAVRLHWNQPDAKPERFGGEQGGREESRKRRGRSK